MTVPIPYDEAFEGTLIALFRLYRAKSGAVLTSFLCDWKLLFVHLPCGFQDLSTVLTSLTNKVEIS